MKKSIICIILSVLILISASVSVSAIVEQTNIIVAEKTELRATHYNENAYQILDNLNITLDERNSRVAELLIQLNSYQHTKVNQDAIIGELERLGIFALESSLPPTDGEISVLSTGNYIAWRGVTITYDTLDDTWLLSAGGNWTNEEWYNDINEGEYTIGQTVNIGGIDGLGIRLYDTYGEYYHTQLVESYMYVADGHGTSNIITSRVAGINPSVGVFFQYQDYATNITPFLGEEDWKYYGNNFSVFARYSQNFENYHGCAAVEYVHTWGNTTITATTATSNGVNYSFNGSNYFVRTGGSDTLF